MAKVKSTLRIHLDPDALIWTPTPMAGILFDSPLKSEPSGGESSAEEEEEVEKVGDLDQVVCSDSSIMTNYAGGETGVFGGRGGEEKAS